MACLDCAFEARELPWIDRLRPPENKAKSCEVSPDPATAERGNVSKMSRRGELKISAKFINCRRL